MSPDERVLAPDVRPGIVTKLGITANVRRVHPRPAKRRAPALTSASVQPPAPPRAEDAPVAPEIITKTRAMSMIEAAGFSGNEFEKTLAVWTDSAIVKRDGMQYLIPKVHVNQYIKKLEAERGENL